MACGISPPRQAVETTRPSLYLLKRYLSINGLEKEFDGVWSSSLTDSTIRGKPDIEAVDSSSRIQNINETFEVTTKPLVYDADTGGLTEHLAYTIRNLERLGVSAVIIEDKTGLKKNSLFGNDVLQEQESLENFSLKIKKAKESCITEDFMIIARIESLILKKGINDALKRAESYISAGADSIMIHSKEKDIAEIREFAEKYMKLSSKVPLVAVPTTYNQIKESENIYIKKNSLNKLFDNATTKITNFIKKNYKKNKILFANTP